MKIRVAVFAALCWWLLSNSPALAQGKHEHGRANLDKLGRVHFPISCNQIAQDQFDRAMALQHSFWYEEAGKAFSAVINMDPNCSMAYWGVALSYYHPLWEPPDKATLQKGWEALQKGKAVGFQTRREMDYIEALEQYYKDGDKLDHRTRALAYEHAMEQLSNRYPDDVEAAILYALALDSTAPITDKSYTNQKKASAILEKIFKDQPDHPGIAHYIIHSNDSPLLASRGLDAARRYAKIAPSVPHALHMPSHIFTRLGLWDESVESNVASASAAEEYAAKNFKDATWDQELHAMDYLMYGYLQNAEDRHAAELFDRVRAIRKVTPENLTSGFALAAMQARYTLERRQWAEAAELTVGPANFPWERVPIARVIQSFAQAVGAVRSKDLAKARTSIEQLELARQQIITGNQTRWIGEAEILKKEATAWLTYAEGNSDAAIRMLREAIATEDSTEKHPVTPGSIIPAHEMLADLFMELNRPADALKEFELALQTTPYRFNSTYGAAKSALLTGDQQKAKKYFAQLLETCKKSTSHRSELGEATMFLAKR